MQEYIKTDRQIHWLSQVIAKVNRTFVSPVDDDSHTNLSYDAFGDRIYGRWIEGPKGTIILGLNLKTFHIEWLDNKFYVLHEVPVFNSKMSLLEKNVSEFLKLLKMDTEGFSQALHYEIPEYHIDLIKETDISASGIKKWKYFRELANNACQDMNGYIQYNSEIRIWPHHFDTGIYSQLNANLGLGFGLGMEDAMIGEPYFYVAGYTTDTPLSYEGVSELTHGEWVTGSHWNGAVLPLSDISEVSFFDSLEEIRTFIKGATDWFLSQ
jgi:hypothetical protein